MPTGWMSASSSWGVRENSSANARRGARDPSPWQRVGCDRRRARGHFVPDENPVYNNMDFVLHELLDVSLVRAWDEATATVEMHVERLPQGDPMSGGS